MIRVDNFEQIAELRKKGITGDILFISRGEETTVKTEVKTEGEKPDTKTEVEKTDTKTEGIDYDKIIQGVTDKLTPIIQEKNRKTGTEIIDETLDDIMKKFVDMD